MKKTSLKILSFLAGLSLCSSLDAVIAVSNHHFAAPGGSLVIGKNFGENVEWSHSFTTGSNSGGYLLEGMSLKFEFGATGTPGPMFIEVFEDVAGLPGDSFAPIDTLSLFSGDPASPGSAFFTGLSSSLDPSTTYWIVVQADVSSSPDPSHYEWQNVNSLGETDFLGDGWSIGNQSFVKTDISFPNWTDAGGGIATLEINASPVPEPHVYALLLGGFSLAFVAYRKKLK